MTRVFALIGSEFGGHMREFLRSAVADSRFRIEVFHDIEDLASLSADRYGILIIYVFIKQIRDDLYEKLVHFVHSGGGMLSLHTTTASFLDRSSFLDVVGARFLRHGPIRKFRVRPAPSQSREFSGIEDFVVEDELYRQKYAGTAVPQFEYIGSRITEPLVWINPYGGGETIGISPGHRMETLKNPSMLEIMKRSLIHLTKRIGS